MKPTHVANISACIALVGASLAALLTGCVSPSPPPLLLALPTFAAAAPASATATAGTAPRVLAVRRVGVPEYLLARRVRYRADAATLGEWPNTFWAERMEIAVMREFVGSVRRQLPGWSVCEASCGDLAPDLSLQVELSPLDFLRSAQQLQAGARIVVAAPGAAANTQQTQELSLAVAAGGDNAQAHAQALADVLQRVAERSVMLVQAAAH
jgi:uncharacterized lipoprotein YmbA